ncbi:MAG TPA: hypothetical protein VGJ82_14020 [Thermoanaerobaculia bacterium]|jgi:hypothetical protein
MNMNIVMIAIVAAAFAQWAFFAFRALLAPQKAKAPLLISSGILFAAWIAAFLPPLLAEESARKATMEASAVTSRTHGTCAAVQAGDSAASVAKKLGPPDEKLNDESVRGPAATTWIYRDTRCAVHIIDNEVDFVE